MANKFNIVAELQLRGPTNIKQTVSKLQKQLSGINANVNVKVNTGQLQQATKNLKAVGVSSQKAATGMSKLGSASQKSVSSVKNVANNLQEASSAANSFGRQSALAVKRFAAFTVGAGIMYGVANSIKEGTKAAIDFERQLIKVSQVTGTSMKSLGALQNTIGNLSTTLGASSAELVDVARILSQTGLTARDVAKSLKVLAQSSLAPTFKDMANTAEGAIAIMRQFGVTADQLAGKLGSINALAGQFAVESQDLIFAIRRAGGAFKAAGGSLEELLALFTSVRATTRESAETIATGFRTIFTRIQRPKTIEFLRSAGVELQNLQGNFIGPMESIKRLNAALKTLESTDPRFQQIIEELGGFRQVSKVIPLIQQFGTAQKALRVAMTGQGSLARDAATAQQTLAVQIDKVRERFLSLFREIASTSTFKAMASVAVNLANAFVNVAESIKPILPLLAAFGTFKMAQFGAQFAGGFFGGLGGAGGGAGLGRGVSGQVTGQNQAATATKHITALTSNTQALIKLTSAISAGGIGRGRRRLATGGLVPGAGNYDTVPAMLTPGEFVIRKSSVKKYGAENLSRMNAGGIVHGGRHFYGNRAAAGRKGAAASAETAKHQKKKRGAPSQNIRGFGTGTYGGKGIILNPKQEDIGAFFIHPSDKDKQIKTSRKKKFAINNDSFRTRYIKDLKAKGYDVDSKRTPKTLWGDMKDGSYSAFGVKEAATRGGTTGKAIDRGAISGMKAGIQKAITDIIRSKAFNIKGLQPLKGNISSAKSQVAQDENVIKSVGGFLFEMLLQSLTGVVPGGKYARMDLPKITGTQGKKLAEIFGAASSVLKIAEVKRSASRLQGKKGLENKVTGEFNERKGSWRQVATVQPEQNFGPIPKKRAGKASGGGIKGSDTVPALLTPGEFVVNRSSAQRIGYGNLNSVNKGQVQGFASGGIVTSGRHSYGPKPPRKTSKFSGMGISGDKAFGLMMLPMAIDAVTQSLGIQNKAFDKLISVTNTAIMAIAAFSMVGGMLPGGGVKGILGRTGKTKRGTGLAGMIQGVGARGDLRRTGERGLYPIGKKATYGQFYKGGQGMGEGVVAPVGGARAGKITPAGKESMKVGAQFAKTAAVAAGTAAAFVALGLVIKSFGDSISRDAEKMAESAKNEGEVRKAIEKDRRGKTQSATGTGVAVGGGIGAAVGMALFPVLGPLGPMITGAIGAAIGGLIGFLGGWFGIFHQDNTKINKAIARGRQTRFLADMDRTLRKIERQGGITVTTSSQLASRGERLSGNIAAGVGGEQGKEFRSEAEKLIPAVRAQLNSMVAGTNGFDHFNQKFGRSGERLIKVLASLQGVTFEEVNDEIEEAADLQEKLNAAKAEQIAAIRAQKDLVGDINSFSEALKRAGAETSRTAHKFQGMSDAATGGDVSTRFGSDIDIEGIFKRAAKGEDVDPEHLQSAVNQMTRGGDSRRRRQYAAALPGMEGVGEEAMGGAKLSKELPAALMEAAKESLGDNERIGPALEEALLRADIGPKMASSMGKQLAGMATGRTKTEATVAEDILGGKIRDIGEKLEEGAGIPDLFNALADSAASLSKNQDILNNMLKMRNSLEAKAIKLGISATKANQRRLNVMSEIDPGALEKAADTDAFGAGGSAWGGIRGSGPINLKRVQEQDAAIQRKMLGEGLGSARDASGFEAGGGRPAGFLTGADNNTDVGLMGAQLQVTQQLIAKKRLEAEELGITSDRHQELQVEIDNLGEKGKRLRNTLEHIATSGNRVAQAQKELADITAKRKYKQSQLEGVAFGGEEDHKNFISGMVGAKAITSYARGDAGALSPQEMMAMGPEGAGEGVVKAGLAQLKSLQAAGFKEFGGANIEKTILDATIKQITAIAKNNNMGYSEAQIEKLAKAQIAPGGSAEVQAIKALDFELARQAEAAEKLADAMEFTISAGDSLIHQAIVDQTVATVTALDRLELEKKEAAFKKAEAEVGVAQKRVKAAVNLEAAGIDTVGELQAYKDQAGAVSDVKELKEKRARLTPGTPGGEFELEAITESAEAFQKEFKEGGGHLGQYHKSEMDRVREIQEEVAAGVEGADIQTIEGREQVSDTVKKALEKRGLLELFQQKVNEGDDLTPLEELTTTINKGLSEGSDPSEAGMTMDVMKKVSEQFVKISEAKKETVTKENEIRQRAEEDLRAAGIKQRETALTELFEPGKYDETSKDITAVEPVAAGAAEDEKMQVLANQKLAEKTAVRAEAATEKEDAKSTVDRKTRNTRRISLKRRKMEETKAEDKKRSEVALRTKKAKRGKMREEQEVKERAKEDSPGSPTWEGYPSDRSSQMLQGRALYEGARLMFEEGGMDSTLVSDREKEIFKEYRKKDKEEEKADEEYDLARMKHPGVLAQGLDMEGLDAGDTMTKEAYDKLTGNVDISASQVPKVGTVIPETDREADKDALAEFDEKWEDKLEKISEKWDTRLAGLGDEYADINKKVRAGEMPEHPFSKAKKDYRASEHMGETEFSPDLPATASAPTSKERRQARAMKETQDRKRRLKQRRSLVGTQVPQGGQFARLGASAGIDAPYQPGGSAFDIDAHFSPEATAARMNSPAPEWARTGSFDQRLQTATPRSAASEPYSGGAAAGGPTAQPTGDAWQPGGLRGGPNEAGEGEGSMTQDAQSFLAQELKNFAPAANLLATSLNVFVSKFAEKGMELNVKGMENLKITGLESLKGAVTVEQINQIKEKLDEVAAKVGVSGGTGKPA